MKRASRKNVIPAPFSSYRFTFIARCFCARLADDAKWSREPFYNESIFYCTINGLALLACSIESLSSCRSFSFALHSPTMVHMKRAKMETADDADEENCSLPLMHQYFVSFLSLFPPHLGFDGLFIDEIEREIKQLRARRVSIWSSCVRLSQHFDILSPGRAVM